MSLGLVMEALARIEHKLDLVLKAMKASAGAPMNFAGHSCPICLHIVNYQISIGDNVVVRRCGCGTGKSPSVIPLLPIVDQKGTTSATPPAPVPDTTSNSG